jgi:hypothetical protein
MSVVQKLLTRVRKPQPTAAAPAKRSRKGLTRGELGHAIFEVCAKMAVDCSARRTLEALYYSLPHDIANDDVVRLEAAPVSCAQFDDAFAQVPELVPAEALGTLKRVRALLAHAEAQKAKEPAQYVTVAQLKAYDAAVFDALGWALGAMAAEFNRGQPSGSHFLSMLGRSANTAERCKVLKAAHSFDESKVPEPTREQWLRYQSSGHW